MQITFEAVAESRPGPKWQALFNRNWPGYKAWFLSRGGNNGPSYATSVKQLRRFMPELLPTYERLVELAGGGDVAARMLSFYRPPAYLLSCSQAVWSRPSGHVLVRNYDLDPALNEGIILHSEWNGRRVIATNECLWGVADGMNDAGLALSLAFGGRKVVGDGFGIPVILRYILEFCETTKEAIAVLRRVPSHMAYNVTVLDRRGDYATALLAPDRPTQVVRQPVATNHQGPIEWAEHARFTGTLERERFLNQYLADSQTTEQALIEAFLRAPLYNTNYRNGFGTLYTAVYRPEQGELELRWPDEVWTQSFEHFQEDKRLVRYTQKASTRQPSEHDERNLDKAPWTDTVWAFNDFSYPGIMQQVFKSIQDTLADAGHPLPARPMNEFLEALDQGNRVPWEKLGSLWVGDSDTDAPSKPEHLVRCRRRHWNKDRFMPCRREYQ